MSLRDNCNTSPILQARGITKRYPGTIALDHVDFSISRGEVVALLGENGAGKSTLAKIIAGVENLSEGAMELEGKPYSPHSPLEARISGISMVHQEMQLLPDLTVAENVFVGHWMRGKCGNLNRAAMKEKAREQLAELGFTKSMDTLVRDLSVAGQQQVEIARALLLDAHVLILDEPTAALGEEETQALFECVRRLQDKGMAFIYVSHRLAEIAQIATRIVVLRDGKFIAAHDDARIDPQVLVSEMVGRNVERLFPDKGVPREKIVLDVKNIHAANNYVKDISFRVREGEVFGIAGLVGAGRTELVRAIVGADPSAHGEVWLENEKIPLKNIRASRDSGLVMVPEDRKQQGILLESSIKENCMIANFDRVKDATRAISAHKVEDLAHDVISTMGVKGDPDKLLRQLSGGNQQKVVIGKWISRSPKVVILDEPTRGIDVGARAAIYEVISALRENGVAVIVVSSDLEEVIGLSHRIMVLNRGRNAGILEGEEINAESVMKRAV